MEVTSLLLVLFYSMVSVSSEAPNGSDVTRVSLRLSPDRSQFFKFQSVFLSCEEDRASDSTVWTLRRTNVNGVTSECGGGGHHSWGKRNGSGCMVRSMLPLLDTALYWCQSPEGNSSTASITVTDGAVVLVGPALPVTEGSDITLRCWSRTKPSGKPSSDHPADFYKDGSLIHSESTGQMTIHSVSKADEGFYKCHISDLGESPQSWMEVTVPGSVERTSPPAPPPPHHDVLGVTVGVSVVAILLLTIVVVLLCRYRTSRDSRPHRAADAVYVNVRNHQRANRK